MAEAVVWSVGHLMRATEQVDAAFCHALANCLVAKAAQNVSEGRATGRQATGGCWLPKLQIKHHNLHNERCLDLPINSRSAV